MPGKTTAEKLKSEKWEKRKRGRAMCAQGSANHLWSLVSTREGWRKHGEGGKRRVEERESEKNRKTVWVQVGSSDNKGEEASRDYKGGLYREEVWPSRSRMRTLTLRKHSCLTIYAKLSNLEHELLSYDPTCVLWGHSDLWPLHWNQFIQIET